jgi:hypothetical protein
MKRFNFALASALAALVLTQGTRIVAQPIPAQPAVAPPAPPVIASSCSGGITSIELVEHAAYDVTFRNTTNVAADDLQLAIPYGRRKVATFDVHTTFAPHVDVRQHLHKNLSGGLFAYTSDENNCEVRYVHFADGTSWSAPNR